MIVYGIPNCNTVKKGITWLKEQGFELEFHDFKKKGLTIQKLNEWFDAFGWERVLNKKGTTWKNLSTAEQASVIDGASAAAVLLKNTSAIKRPIVEVEGKPVLIGFDEEAYASALK